MDRLSINSLILDALELTLQVIIDFKKDVRGIWTIRGLSEDKVMLTEFPSALDIDQVLMILDILFFENNASFDHNIIRYWVTHFLFFRPQR